MRKPLNGYSIQDISVEWIESKGYKKPSVVITKEKEKFAEIAYVTHFLEDCPKMLDKLSTVKDLKVYKCSAGYNKECFGIPVKNSLEFIDIIKKEE